MKNLIAIGITLLTTLTAPPADWKLVGYTVRFIIPAVSGLRKKAERGRNGAKLHFHHKLHSGPGVYSKKAKGKSDFQHRQGRKRHP